MTGEGFVRPRFFGGMLLTEDDLQAAVDYGVAKRRLTNRHVIGAGVVCGLDVTCHRCDARKVEVSPGYAIECCGNDILVSCPEEVDIIDLVRDLRRRTGVDCGEPCDDQPSQEYHLYVRYAEAQTAPVAPYASDDCATGDCEFSRVREGYCFELRCDPPDDVPTLTDAIEACRPDDDDLKRDSAEMARVVRLASKHSAVVETLAAGPEPIPPAPTKGEFDQLAGGDLALDEGVELVRRATLALAFDAAAQTGGGPSPRLNTARRNLIGERGAELAARLRESQELRARPPQEIERIERILVTAETRPDLSGLGAADRAWLAEGTSAPEAERAFVAGAQRMQGRILRGLAGLGQTTCDEYRTVSRLRFDRLTTSSKEDALALGRAYLRAFLACACSVFNPPCPTCTDDAVLLARVRVDGCEVIDVCALERRWVLSPRAFGYWVPVVEMVRELLEGICCGGVDPDPTDAVRASLAQARATGERVAMNLAGAAGARPELHDLLREMGRPVAAETGFSASAATATTASAERSVRDLQTEVADLRRRLDELTRPETRKED